MATTSSGKNDEAETEHLAPDDADLDDLLSHPEQQPPSVHDLGTMMNAYCTYATYTHPRLCTCLVISGIALAMILFVNLVFNPTETFGTIAHDYTNIQSEFDLKVGDIDHWCLKGDNDSCRCEDPLEPSPRAEYKSWVRAHKMNKQQVEDNLNQAEIAFMGESLIEEMDGRWMGIEAPTLQAVAKTFHKNFQKDDQPKAVALGIAGDTSPNVLWRLQHGEAPDNFNPKIWWLSLGMNDLGRMQCSEEVVVMGILAVVEQILTMKPKAKIVVNSILPMADLRGGTYPTQQDFKDAFRGKRSGVPQNHFARNRPATINKTGGNGGGRFLRKQPVKDADEESKLTKRQKKQFNKKIKKDPVNPKVKSDQTKIKKYDPKKLFMKQNRLPLWTSISAINRELKKFCNKHDSVSFYDATSIFTERDQSNQVVLLSELISVRGHPTEEGYKVWEEAVKKKVDNMLESIEEEEQQTEAPKPAPVMKDKEEDGPPRKENQGD